MIKKMMLKLKKSKIYCILQNKIYLSKLGYKLQKHQYMFQIMKKMKMLISKANLVNLKIKDGKNRAFSLAQA